MFRLEKIASRPKELDGLLISVNFQMNMDLTIVHRNVYTVLDMLS